MQSRTLTRHIPNEHYHHHARLKYNKSIYLRAQMKTSNKQKIYGVSTVAALILYEGDSSFYR